MDSRLGAAATTGHDATIRAVLVAGGLLTAVVSIPAIELSGQSALLCDNIQQIVATLAAILVLLLVVRRDRPGQQRVGQGLAIALVFTAVGQILWDIQPGGSTTASEVADVVFVTGVAGGLILLGREVFGGLDRRMVQGVGIDAAALFAATMTVVAAFWLRAAQGVWTVPTLLALLPAAVVLAGSGAGFIGLVARRVRPGVYGPWLVAAGLCGASIAWLAWLQVVTVTAVNSVMATDFLFSASVLLIAVGAATWSLVEADDPAYEAVAMRIGDWVPTLAVLASMALELVPRARTGLDAVDLGVASIVVAVAIRQRLLLTMERQARTAEHEASMRLERETRERADTLVSLSRLEPGGTPEATARLVCAEGLRLEGIDSAQVLSFGQDGEVIPLAVEGLGNVGRELSGLPLPSERALLIRSRASLGSWIEIIDPTSTDPHIMALSEAGLRGTVNVPLRWNDRVIGALGLGSFVAATDGEHLAARLPTGREFGLMAAAILGPALAERQRTDDVRATVASIIGATAFQPVFQPVIELATQRVVGFEALTRFDDGTRPDRHFADAAAAGVGPLLELACLRAAIRQGVALPADAWLSLNVSPQLAMAVVPLVALLEGIPERRLVVEITEHVPVEDYEILMRALGTLRGHVQLAVDDAGAGYAGLRHILELQPHFVKLDISLVHSVDADPARRAMIGSMIAFARETGCMLIAEGIERPAELETLRTLGVCLGQGFLLGSPASVDAWSAGDRATSGAKGRLHVA